MTTLPAELHALIDAGPLTHLTTINADGSPHVNVIWIGVDGDQLVSGHMSHKRIARNIEPDPRVVLSFDAPRQPGMALNPAPCCRPTPPSSPATTPGTRLTT